MQSFVPGQKVQERSHLRPIVAVAAVRLTAPWGRAAESGDLERNFNYDSGRDGCFYCNAVQKKIFFCKKKLEC